MGRPTTEKQIENNISKLNLLGLKCAYEIVNSCHYLIVKDNKTVIARECAQMFADCLNLIAKGYSLAIDKNLK